jgi:hypothetical protein
MKEWEARTKRNQGSAAPLWFLEWRQFGHLGFAVERVLVEMSK